MYLPLQFFLKYFEAPRYTSDTQWLWISDIRHNKDILQEQFSTQKYLTAMVKKNLICPIRLLKISFCSSKKPQTPHPPATELYPYYRHAQHFLSVAELHSCPILY